MAFRRILTCWLLFLGCWPAVLQANDETEYVQKFDCSGYTVKISPAGHVVWQNDDESLFNQERASLPEANLVWAPGKGVFFAGDTGVLYSGSGQPRRRYAWSDIERPQGATFDGEGNVYLAVDGYDNGEISPPPLKIIKRNAAGEQLWSREIKPSGYRVASPAEIRVIEGNAVLVTGTFEAADYADRGLFVAKIDDRGELSWTGQYPEMMTDGRVLATDEDGDIYVGGVRNDYDWRDETQHLLLGKLNAAGHWLWIWKDESLLSPMYIGSFGNGDTFRLTLDADKRITLVRCSLGEYSEDAEDLVFPNYCEAVTLSTDGGFVWSSAGADLPAFNALTTTAEGDLLFSGRASESADVEPYLHTHYFDKNGNRRWSRLYPPVCLPEAEEPSRKSVTADECAALAAKVVGECGFKVHSPTGAELTQEETRKWCEATVAAWGGQSPDSELLSYWTCLEKFYAFEGCDAEIFTECEDIYHPDSCCAMHYRRMYDCGHPKVLSEEPLWYFPRLDAYTYCTTQDEPVVCLADCAEDFCNDDGAEYQACVAACWEEGGESAADYNSGSKYTPMAVIAAPSGNLFLIGAEFPDASLPPGATLLVLTYDAAGNLLNHEQLKGKREYTWPTDAVLDENGALYIACASCKVYETPRHHGSSGGGGSDEEGTETMCGCRAGTGGVDPLAAALMIGGLAALLLYRRGARGGLK